MVLKEHHNSIHSAQHELMVHMNAYVQISDVILFFLL